MITDDIELDNLDKDREEEETPFDNDWRNESIMVIDTSTPDAKKKRRQYY